MAKKSGALFLTKLYIITVIGFALNLHFCEGALASVRIDGPAKTCIKVPPTGKMNGCNDKQVDVKIKDAHQAESPSFFSQIFGFEITQIPFGAYVLSAQQAVVEKLSNKPPPPPPSGKTSQFIKNCTLKL
jgi:hypothetical protein